MNHHEDPEFDQSCKELLALTAIKAAEKMNTDDKLMIYRGMIGLFPKDSAEQSNIQSAYASLASFRKNQGHLVTDLKTDH